MVTIEEDPDVEIATVLHRGRHSGLMRVRCRDK